MLVICTCLPLGRFDSLATFCWWWSRRNTYSKTQIPIDNRTTSKIKFYSSDLLSVLAMDCLLEAIVNYSKSADQTYKSLSHRFCSPTNGSLLPNIQLVNCILYQWTSFLSFFLTIGYKSNSWGIRQAMSIVFFKMEQSNWEQSTCEKNSRHRKTRSCY